MARTHLRGPCLQSDVSRAARCPEARQSWASRMASSHDPPLRLAFSWDLSWAAIWSACMWPVQHGGLKGVGLLCGWLAAPKRGRQKLHGLCSCVVTSAAFCSLNSARDSLRWAQIRGGGAVSPPLARRRVIHCPGRHRSPQHGVCPE